MLSVPPGGRKTGILWGAATCRSAPAPCHIWEGEPEKVGAIWTLGLFMRSRHHEYGPQAVHNNRKNRILLCRAAQETFEMKYPRSLFLQEFGISYLDKKREEHNEKNRQQDTIEDGFIRMETGLDELPF